ncbi:MAG: hypothetical protein ACRDNY_04405 [Gaiellaceae bacterium]
MLTTCSEPGCSTLVMGGRCIEHERPQMRVFVRGRPYVAPRVRALVTTIAEAERPAPRLGIAHRNARTRFERPF